MKTVSPKFWIVAIIIYFVLCMLFGCASPRMACPVYKDTYERHWMNKKFGTNILYHDTERYFTTKHYKCNK